MVSHSYQYTDPDPKHYCPPPSRLLCLLPLVIQLLQSIFADMVKLGLVLPIIEHGRQYLDARDRAEVLAEPVLIQPGEKVAGWPQSICGIRLGPFPWCPRGNRALTERRSSSLSWG